MSKQPRSSTYLLVTLSYSVIAIFSILIDPSFVSAQAWTQEQKLTANDAVAGIGFGDSGALGDNIAFVGATANGVANVSAGAVYVLVWNSVAGEWEHVAKLTADDGELDDRLGWSVSFSGDAVITGAPDDDDNGNLSGSAYVFRFDGEGWPQEQKLTADDGQASDRFGRAVAINGDVAIVGAPNAAGSGGPTGAAYVFRYNGETWQQEQKLQVGTFATIAAFGTSVAASGNRLLVGVPQAGPGAQNLGAAYVFKYDGDSWEQDGVLSASDQDPQDKFGSSVALDGDVALMGVPQDGDGGAFAGAAYIFRYDGNAWQQEQKLLANDPAASDLLGSAVALSGNVAVVGAPSAGASGAAYIFEYNGTSWALSQKVLQADQGIGDNFGQSAGAFGDKVLLGASNNDDGGESAGSAYVFTKGGMGTAVEDGAPTSFSLSLQTYPNPFGDMTTFAYELPSAGRVRISVYDILGRQVAEIVDQHASAGVHTRALNSDRLPSGLYLARLETDSGVTTSRILKAN